jgi:Fe-S cluster assembly iron-binding protein IscA
MSVESFTPTALQFTQGAANKVKNLVDEEGNPRLKLRGS